MQSGDSLPELCRTESARLVQISRSKECSPFCRNWQYDGWRWDAAAY